MRLSFFGKIEAKLLSPEDTHALLCVPVVEELQAEKRGKLGRSVNFQKKNFVAFGWLLGCPLVIC